MDGMEMFDTVVWLVILFGIFYSHARWRGFKRWSFFGPALVVYLGITVPLLLWVSPPASTIAMWILFVAMEAVVIVKTRGKSPHSWQCPDCGLFNEPANEACACGRRRQGEGALTESVARADG